MINPVPAILAGVAVLLVAGLAWWLHHAGYVAGQAERTEYYEPLFKAANDAKLAADLHASDVEAQQRAMAKTMEDEYAAMVKEMAIREAAAADRIAGILRSAKSRAPSCGSVPEAGKPPGVPNGIAASDARDRQLSVSVSGVGGQCEHDAAAVSGWQDWYQRQQALINGPQK